MNAQELANNLGLLAKYKLYRKHETNTLREALFLMLCKDNFDMQTVCDALHFRPETYESHVLKWVQSIPTDKERVKILNSLAEQNILPSFVVAKKMALSFVSVSSYKKNNKKIGGTTLEIAEKLVANLDYYKGLILSL